MHLNPWINERIAEHRREEAIARAERKRLIRAVARQAGRRDGVRHAVGAAVVRVGIWISGRAEESVREEWVRPRGRLSSAS